LLLGSKKKFVPHGSLSFQMDCPSHREGKRLTANHLISVFAFSEGTHRCAACKLISLPFLHGRLDTGAMKVPKWVLTVAIVATIVVITGGSWFAG
jgi:hypothetical protein